ncbi:RagB/SusD family nutrient uptake outer membrane protein [Limibacter armeniacum]|uniref:RagB/SusD family nutrient uptake outer membrane protein n=1 Tax=Limibacter armeniacum TaxID=466084 RepID=UPI002FE5E2EF
MKKLYRIFIVILAASLAACDFDLNQSPITEKESSNFFKSEIEIEEAVYGVYGALRSNGVYELGIPVIGEISSDNTFDEVPANDGGNYGELDEFTVIPSNSVIASIWKDSYVAIQRANVVLNRIGDIPFKDEYVKQNRIGEMKFLRGLLYFNLVRIYGDVPLIIEETTDVNAAFGVERAAVSEVYNQIIQDLKAAIEVLPLDGGADGRAEKGAAQALLAKVHLTLKDYANAKQLLDQVQSSGQYGLLESGNDIFAIANKGNREVMFAVKFESGINGNSMGSSIFRMCTPSGYYASGKGHNIPTEQLYSLYEDGDLRKESYVKHVEGIYYVSGKMDAPTTVPDDAGNDFVVLRFADVLLMSAEVENELGNTALAAEMLNKVRQRSGASEVLADGQVTLRSTIAAERQMELVGEGHRWFDLLRTGQAIEVMNKHFAERGQNIVVDQDNLLMPIPQSQIDADPVLNQNPGY